MRKMLSIAAVVALAGLAVSAPGASARTCGSYGTTTDGETIETDAYYGATCTLAEATATRFFAVSGVPRRVTALGTRMTHRTTKRSDGATFWLYDGRRNGRYASVIITIEDAAPVAPSVPTPTTGPTVLPPGNGYTVICNDGSISTSGGIQGACSHHGGVSG